MYRLKYKKIPNKWINGLPIGNGRLAAMLWGTDNKDILSINHECLWRGKYRGKEAGFAADKLPYLRDLLRKRDYSNATAYANTFFGGQGGDSGVGVGRIDSYQPAGTLVLTYLGQTSCSESGLDINNAVAYVKRETDIQGEFFCDSNDGCIMARWQGSGLGETKISFGRVDDPEADYSVNYAAKTIDFACRFICGISYHVKIRLKTDGNPLVCEDGIQLKDATELICSINIILEEKDEREHILEFDDMLKLHSKKFNSYMDRMSFKLEVDGDNAGFTDERIKAIRAGVQDEKLKELFFHYGRYLMISCCVCASFPPNLQGKWNDDIVPPWESDYHMDINFQMNEWMIEGANLSEFAMELTTFLFSFLESGKKAAKNLYGCRGIWLPIACDIWAECTPEAFGYAVWVGAAAWMAQPLWKHYIYTGDMEYLKNYAYPFFKEVALFYEDFLEEDANGVLQIMPSQSPENRFVGAGNVATVGTCSSSAIDVQLAYDALGYAIKAARILNIDDVEVNHWEILKSKLPPFSIGSDGRLLEWNEEFEEEQPGHKHLSHLYGLFPSDIFTPGSRKDEYDAAVKSFEHRIINQSGYTGWSRAWISNIYARIGNKEGFYTQLTGLIRDFATESLLDIHPDPVEPGVGPDIFQIDGNFGMVSAVMEALCCYFDGKAYILHALPEAWQSGSISGMKLPGGHEICVKWEKGEATSVEVTIGFEQSLTLVIGGKDILIKGNVGDQIKVIS